MRAIFTRNVLALLVILASAGLHAQPTWTETTDAGELLGSAQEIFNLGDTLTTITGSVGYNGDRDLYRVFVKDFTQFSANTHGSGADTWLFLFDEDGYPVAFNDDDPVTANGWSALPAGHALYASRPPGVYHIAVACPNSKAHGALGLLFWCNYPSTAVEAPVHTTLPGGTAAPLSSWASTNHHNGPYVLNLTGCAPTPLRVTNRNDSGAGSLRAAVAAASATAPGQMIWFWSGMGAFYGTPNLVTIDLGSTIAINKPLRIVAPANPQGGTYIALNGMNQWRVLHVGSVSPGQPITVSVRGVRIQNGMAGATADGGGLLVSQPDITLNLEDVQVDACNAGNDGGGIYAAQTGVTLNLTRTRVTGCTAARGGGMVAGEGVTVNLAECEFAGNTASTTGPGGVQFFSQGGTAHTITRCTFATNTGASGAGAMSLLNLTASGTVTATLLHCTFSGNSTTGTGGGAMIAGAVMSGAGVAAAITNCTFAGNTGGTASVLVLLASNAGSSAQATYRNTILAGASPCVVTQGAGTTSAVSDNNNICSDATANLTGANDQPGTDPMLDSLADNGGSTRTRLPQIGSPAIDRGRAISGVTTDQRGFVRPLDDFNVANGANSDGSDIGAVENYPAAPTLALAAGSSFTTADHFHQLRAAGDTLTGATLDVDDATGTDNVTMTVSFDSGPLGTTPLIGIAPPSSQIINAASLPFAISWSGTISTANAAGVYTWRIDLNDQTRVTTWYVRIEVQNVLPALSPPTGVTTSPGTFGTVFIGRLLTGTVATVNIIDCADANLGDTVSVSVLSKMSTPQNSTLQFTLGIAAPGNPVTFTIAPNTTPGAGDRGIHIWYIEFTDGLAFVGAYAALNISDQYPPTITSPPAPANAADGLPYTHQFVADANPAATFSIVAGALPAWATLTSQGLLSGTAVLGQNGTFTVRASNGINPPADEVVTITVTTAQTPIITSGTPPATVAAGDTYLFQFTATGIPAVTWSVAGNPLWLNLDPISGLLSGVPQGLHAGTTGTITVTATNPLGSDNVAFTVQVTVTAPVITSSAPPTTAQAGQSYLHTFTATGNPAVTWGIAGHPVWLTLNPATGELSGTPGAGDGGVAGPITVTAFNGVAPSDSVTWLISVSLPGGGGGGGDDDDGCSTSGRRGGSWTALAMLLTLLVLRSRAARTAQP
ncbi:MAG: hypothetical protein HS108_03745 [Planctomycetes bacterium]|nr:hypothetical protein [Planctomycetota bacterium]